MDLEILKIASENNSNKYLENHTHHSRLKNPLCGDEIKINLIIKDNKIIDFSILLILKKIIIGKV